MQTTTINTVSVARYYLAIYRADQPYTLRQQSFQVYSPEKLFKQTLTSHAY